MTVHTYERMIAEVRSKWAIAGAALWAAGLPVAGALLPAYTSSSAASLSAPSAPGSPSSPASTAGVVTSTVSRTLVQVNGDRVLIILAIPLLLVLAVALLLPAHRQVAWVITGFAFVFVFLGAFTIGPLVVPVAILLLVACALDYAFPSTPASP